MQKATFALDALLERCTVRLWSQDRQRFGTGFFVAPGLVVSCAHVIGEKNACGQLLPAEWGNTPLSATLIKLFPDPCPLDNIFPDVAILRVQLTDHPIVLLDPDFGKGDPISSWGFSDLRGGGESIFGSCEGSVKYDHTPEKHLIKFKETQIRPGISGSPLLNERTAAVCGVIKRTRDSDREAGGLAIRGEILLQCLEGIIGDITTQKRQATEWLEAREQADTSFQHYLSTLKAYTSSAYRTLPLPRGLGIDEVYVPLRLRLLDRNVANGVFEVDGLFHSLTLSPKGRNVLVQAAPGAGKSTLLRHVAHNAFDHPRELGLDGKRIPLLVRLQSLAVTKGVRIEDRLMAAIEHAKDYQLERLPRQDFFSQWPHLFNAKWLMLCDGFDEVPRDNRAEVIQFMLQMMERGCELFVTTRPTESFGPEFNRLFNIYSIDSFSSEQQRDLATKWFGAGADLFLDNVTALGANFLGTTPLLLTIAASVFESKKRLPARRAALYQEFIDRWWEEATSRGAREELGDDFDNAIPGLQQIARIMSFRENTSTVDVANELTTILAQKLGTSEDMIRAKAEHLIDILGRRSGVFIVRGKDSEWLHRTFREYLCARAFSTLDPDSQDAISLARKWKDDQWRQIVLFCVSFWSQQYSVSRLIRRIAKVDAAPPGNKPGSPSVYGLVFAADAIADGASVDADLQREIFEQLCRQALINTEGTICVRLLSGLTDDSVKRADETLRAITELKHLPSSQSSFDQLVKSMVSFARRWRKEMGNAAVHDLAALGCQKELLELAKNQSVHNWVRYEAADKLRKIGGGSKAVSALCDVLLEGTPSEAVSTRILDALGEAGASQELLRVAHLQSFDLSLRIRVAKIFDERANLEALRELADDQSLHPAIRERAMVGLLGKIPEEDARDVIEGFFIRNTPNETDTKRIVCALAEVRNWNALLSVIKCPGIGKYIVEECLSQLEGYDRTEELTQIIEMEDVPRDYRWLAAKRVRKKAKAEEVNVPLLALYADRLQSDKSDAETLKERAALYMGMRPLEGSDHRSG